MLKLIEEADHTFNTKHPWSENVISKNLEKVVDSSILFIEKQQ